jgi:hypothetical protein
MLTCPINNSYKPAGTQTHFVRNHSHSTPDNTKIHVDTKGLAYIIIRHIHGVRTHQKSPVRL